MLKVLIVFYLVVLGFLIYIIYINGFTEKMSMLFYKAALLPLMAMVGLLLYDLLSPLPKKTLNVPVLLLQTGPYEIAPFRQYLDSIGHGRGAGYERIDMLSFNWRKEAKKLGPLPPADDLPFFYTDLLELAIWQWLGDTFPLHWQVERRFFRGISGGGGEIHPTGNMEDQTIKTREQIAAILNGNTLLEKGFLEAHLRAIFLPEHTFVSVDRSNGLRTYTFRNEYAIFEIRIRRAGGEQIGAGRVADILRSAYNIQRPWARHFSVEFRFSPMRLRRWSPKTEQQERWAVQLMDLFREAFDWDLVRTELERR